MPYILLIVVFVIGVVLFVKLRKSKWLDSFTEDLTHEPDKSFKETDTLIDGVKGADAALEKRVVDNATAAGEIERDTKKINDFKGKGETE